MPSISQALTAGPGRRLAAIPVTTLATGQEVAILVHVLQGQKKGPRVAVVLGTHGSETFVTELFRVFLSNLELGELAGTLLVVPMANTSAFEAGTRHTPQDAMNVNRMFPGNPRGWYTEMLAHALATGLVAHADWVFDYHCPHDKARANWYTYTLDRSSSYGRTVHELAVASGAPVLHEAPPIPGSLMEFCKSVGVPTFVPEIGGSPAVDVPHMEIGLRELHNALRHLKMLPGPITGAGKQLVVKKSEHVRPLHGGLFVPAVNFDDLAKPIQDRLILGTVYNVTTLEALETVRAPFPRYVLMSLRMLSKVDPGDYAFSVGDADSAETLN